MKGIIASVGVAVLAAFVARAEDAKVQSPDRGTVSMTLDNVDLEIFIRMVTRLSGVNLSFDPNDAKFRESTSVNVQDKPWKTVLTSVLGQHGLLLVEDEPGSHTYSIVRAQSAGIAARLRASQEAVTFADAVMAELNSGNLAAARERIAKYREHNNELVRTVGEKQQKSANPPSEGMR